MVESTSPALMRREQLLLQAFFQAGHFFTPDRNGVTSELVPLLHRYGIHNVQTRIHTLEYRAGTIEGQYFAEDMGHGFRTLLPFMRKWGQMPDDYETIYQQMLSEMQQPDFVATWNFVTAWGRRS
jgi:hypothetical protein